MILKTYNNCKCELEVAKHRLSYLIDRKNELFKQIGTDIDIYNELLMRVDVHNGMSLEGEIEQQYKIIQNLKRCIKAIEYEMRNLKGIEYALYCEIVLDGTPITRAVEKIALENYIDISTVWRNYYPHIKYKVKEIKTIMSSDYLV